MFANPVKWTQVISLCRFSQKMKYICVLQLQLTSIISVILQYTICLYICIENGIEQPDSPRMKVLSLNVYGLLLLLLLFCEPHLCSGVHCVLKNQS